MLVWLVLVLVALAGLLFYLGSDYGALGDLPHGPVAAGVVLVLLVLYALTARTSAPDRRDWRRWLFITILASALAAGLYLSREQLSIAALTGLRKGQLNTDATTPAGFHSVRIRRNAEGLFFARGEVNGQPVNLMIDTGASAVLLRNADAEQAGIDVRSLAFSVPVETANGPARAAAVRLRSLAIGSVAIVDLEALVAEPGSLNESLLGMTFLRRLRSYEIAGDFITLRE